MKLKRFGTGVLALAIGLLCLNNVSMAQEKLDYQRPPEHLAKLFDAPQTPSVYLNPQNTLLVLLERPGNPSIEEVAQPELRLAGIRINPKTNGPSRSYSFNKLTVKELKSGKEFGIQGMPDNPRIENLSWAPDGSKMAFTIVQPGGYELWYADLETKEAKKLTEAVLNNVFSGNPYSWVSNSKQLVARFVRTDRGQAPKEPIAPEGPVIQSNTGGEAPVRTYQDLLKNKFDEDLFAYYSESQLMLVNLDGKQKKLGDAGIFAGVSISPDGNYIMVRKIKRPFSYIVPYSRFAQTYEVWNIDGQLVKQIADIPASEKLPKGFDAVRTDKRAIQWRDDVAATLVFTEALDEGDPEKDVEFREKVSAWPAPFTGQPQELCKLQLRFGGISWADDNYAIVSEYMWKTRRVISSSFAPANPQAGLKEIFNRSYEDRYNDPGSFETTVNKYGRYVLLKDKTGKKLFLTGSGASPEGNKPFIDEFDIATHKTNRLWQSKAPHYEYAVSLMDVSKNIALIRRESKTEVPNYFIIDYKKSKDKDQLTNFPHPYPSLKDVKSELVHYEREDGVKLSGKLYTPAGYDPAKDGKLPVLMWAYPSEYKSASAAGQVSDSPYRFIRIHAHSPLYWVADGYAVFDDPAFPVVGEGDEEPNDSFVKQLVANAQAAVDVLVERGVADPKRIAVGGHSYGAFMTANLLTHSDLFAAGIARSGAYNRTLTPFGFQAEERTYWDAPEIYYTMSPFMHADKMDHPLLMLHGEADNNSGTYPMQSERYFAALKGNGKIARLVMLPHESHGYRGQESIMHMAWEMTEWLNKYVKNIE